MRVNLNLATRPFGRSRLFWLASGIAGAVLLITAIALVSTYVNRASLPESEVAAEHQLRTQLVQLSSQQSQLGGTLGTEETIDVYDRSHFLNQLLVRKSISWTKTFADLEGVLPPRVLMMQIRPEVTYDNQVDLEMQVGAETPADFIEFLQSLESSELFGPPEPRGYMPPTENDPYHRYELKVRYEQRL